ncbi:PREDICTED: uncharacterized protein LOC104816995 [Tarenaya hassleriana]|uniref:uncharacterized protein LOC104816995 n=1 Tax=Tarenaya hassleriana TaxID=28532 RepID=UPI00053C80D4|nr:PREDICTED: uncharacterized protein LOC104816995 [Tarenaya hassleriana]
MASKTFFLESIMFLLLPLLLLLPVFASSRQHGNPANEIVDFLNKNRTAQKLAKLNNSPGLGCMALQYIELCKGNCSGNNDAANCKPPDDDFTEVFAPNCGVELPTLGTLTGHIVGCMSKYVQPEPAFSDILVRDRRELSILVNKSHTGVGVGIVGFHKGPFFWCVLFSNGQTNSTFVLEDNGRGIKQKEGCYSGSAFACSSGRMISFSLLSYALSLALLFCFIDD